MTFRLLVCQMCGKKVPFRKSGHNYCLKSEVSITLHCQPSHSSTSQELFKIAPLQSKYPLHDFHYEGEPSRAIANQHFSLSAKMNGTQRRTLVTP